MILEIEMAIAAHNEAYALATLEVNPFSEAETLDLGHAKAVYVGAVSPIHGVVGLGLEGEVTPSDLKQIENFFFKKERPATFWITPETHPSLLDLMGPNYKATTNQKIYGAKDWELSEEKNTSSTPELNDWPLAFTKTRKPTVAEPDLEAVTILHQKNARFYMNISGAASYTFFYQGIALAPIASDCLPFQMNEAKQFNCSWFITLQNTLPLLYERTLYEPI